jgi:polysaccharide biosynthesis/export protein
MFSIMNWRSLLLTCSLLAAAGSLIGQPVPTAPGQDPNQQPNQQQEPNPAQAARGLRDLPQDNIRPNYVLGANDQILVREPNTDEINEKPFRIDSDGNVNMPLVGRIHVTGMTVQEFEADLTTKLRDYIRDPHPIISVVQFRSEPVFFVGAFKTPGIYPLQGRRTLVEMLAAIGGTQSNASQHIKVTRRAEYGVIPLPGAIEDPEKKISTVEISIGSLRTNANPAEDILLQPYDVISVERAEQIYMSGEVNRNNAIELGERDSISILQALTLAGGFTKDSAKGKVRILRPILNTNRRYAIEVDLQRLLEGKDSDVPLLPNDIVYVPKSYTRVFWQTAGQVLLPLIPSLVFLGDR